MARPKFDVGANPSHPDRPSQWPAAALTAQGVKGPGGGRGWGCTESSPPRGSGGGGGGSGDSGGGPAAAVVAAAAAAGQKLAGAGCAMIGQPTARQDSFHCPSKPSQCSLRRSAPSPRLLSRSIHCYPAVPDAPRMPPRPAAAARRRDWPFLSSQPSELSCQVSHSITIANFSNREILLLQL